MTYARLLRAALILACIGGVAAAVHGCYKPAITNGGLACGTSTTPSDQCPDGFKCNPVDHMCWKPGTGPTGGTGGGTDAGGAGGSGGMAGTGGRGGTGGGNADGGPCFDARPNCDPSDAGICDPFCQTGCGCHQKCSVAPASGGGSALTCQSLANRPTPPQTVLGACMIDNAGSPSQADECKPGQICMNAECGSRCYQFCRTDNDCNNASCSRTAGAGQTVCDVMFTNCDPVAGAAATSCGGNTVGCYISTASSGVRTLCDCPFQGGGNGAPCARSRDCLPGLLCVDPNTGTTSGSPTCHQVCRVGGADGGAGETECAGGAGNCSAYMGSTVYGYCRF